MKFEGGAVDDKGVPGVDATLVAHNHMSFFTQKVGDFAFALVAPLSAHYNNVCQEDNLQSPTLYITKKF